MKPMCETCKNLPRECDYGKEGKRYCYEHECYINSEKCKDCHGEIFLCAHECPEDCIRREDNCECVNCLDIILQSEAIYFKCETCKLMRENISREQKKRETEQKRKKNLKAFRTVMAIGFLVVRYVI